MKVEEEYLGVLQNLEFTVVHFYHLDETLNDSHVQDAYGGLIRRYKMEVETGKLPTKPPFMSGKGRKLYDELLPVCEVQVGRGGEGLADAVTPIPVETLLLCLRRLKSSCEFWTKNEGSRGYLNYIGEFLPGK